MTLVVAFPIMMVVADHDHAGAGRVRRIPETNGLFGISRVTITARFGPS